jgi:hypothetical protein
MDVCPRSSVACFPVQLEALQRPDTPFKQSYKTSSRGFENLEILQEAKAFRSRKLLEKYEEEERNFVLVLLYRPNVNYNLQ